MTHKTRTRTLRQAFVATVATAGTLMAVGCIGPVFSEQPAEECPSEKPAFGAACGASADVSCTYEGWGCGDVHYTCEEGAWNSWDDGTCNPPPPAQCPDARPNTGDACSPDLEGWNCNYLEPICGFEETSTCTDGIWDSPISSCNPPPPVECPVEMPVAGAECEAQPWAENEYPTNCYYDAQTPCGPQAIEMGCAFDAFSETTKWEVTTAPTCNATPQQCQDYGDKGGCNADPSCGWQVPGCNDDMVTPDVVEGCYPTGDCRNVGCGDWGTCETVMVDPCADAPCGACAGELDVCVPNSP